MGEPWDKQTGQQDDKASEGRQTTVSATPKEAPPEQKLAALEDKYLRAVADLANAHKRFQKEREHINQTAVAAFVKKLLPVIDNMSHSLRSAQDTQDPALLISGFKLIEEQILNVLAEIGVKPIEAEGKKFDPELHHAVFPVVTAEVQEGTITEETGRGFIMGDFVIRPAQVKVAVAPTKKGSDTE